jgi:hypothetical protein
LSYGPAWWISVVGLFTCGREGPAEWAASASYRHKREGGHGWDFAMSYWPVLSSCPGDEEEQIRSQPSPALPWGSWVPLLGGGRWAGTTRCRGQAWGILSVLSTTRTSLPVAIATGATGMLLMSPPKSNAVQAVAAQGDLNQISSLYCRCSSLVPLVCAAELGPAPWFSTYTAWMFSGMEHFRGKQLNECTLPLLPLLLLPVSTPTFLLRYRYERPGAVGSPGSQWQYLPAHPQNPTWAVSCFCLCTAQRQPGIWIASFFLPPP